MHTAEIINREAFPSCNLSALIPKNTLAKQMHFYYGSHKQSSVMKWLTPQTNVFPLHRQSPSQALASFF